MSPPDQAPVNRSTPFIPHNGLRLGVCCLFKAQPIRFRRTTAKYLSQFSRPEQLSRLSLLCLANARALKEALVFCRDSGIGGFRINSQILPLKTHPEVGYDIRELPQAETIIKAFMESGEFSRNHCIRTSFHPDQFIVLSSPDSGVVKRSMADLAYQSQVAQWVNADVINIHAGGVYGDKPGALKRLKTAIESLPDPVRTRLTLENDDRSYTPQDLLPVCRETSVPLVYDVHHHRCLKDGMGVEEVTHLAVETWNREPLFHVSSPLNGWKENDRRKHHDYIHIKDFPMIWRVMDLTVEVEAKAKELAVLKLLDELKRD